MTKTFSDLKQMDAGKIRALILEERKRRLSLLLQKGSGQLKDLSQMRKSRRLVARAKTALAILKRGVA